MKNISWQVLSFIYRCPSKMNIFTEADGLALGTVNNEEVLQLLECPVCLDHITPPMKQCVKGHLVCNECFPRLPHCPTCRSPMNQERNLAIGKFKFPPLDGVEDCSNFFMVIIKLRLAHGSEQFFAWWKVLGKMYISLNQSLSMGSMVEVPYSRQ